MDAILVDGVTRPEAIAEVARLLRSAEQSPAPLRILEIADRWLRLLDTGI